MSAAQDKRQKQTRQARQAIESELYLRGYSIRQIAREVQLRLGLEKTPSTAVIHRDVKLLLAEWRADRIENVDEAVQLELQRIDFACRELWDQWEKSKEDFTKRSATKRMSGGNGTEGMQVERAEQSQSEVRMLGDPRYISEIRQQLAERRKLLGLYAPEKREISGDMSFASFLVESGQVEGAGDELNEEGLL